MTFSMNQPVNLSRSTLPSDVEWETDLSGGTNVECVDCGYNEQECWENGGVTDYVWDYSADRRGFGIWVHAECKACGRVEVFEDSGGNDSGYARDPRDYDRRHRDAHAEWKRRNAT